MKSKLNNKIKVPLLILGALLVLIALISGGVYARYLSQRGNVDGTASSQNFYFESDYLKAEGATYAVNPSVSGTVIPFTLMNYADEYRVSELDVDYSVTVKDSAGNAVNTVTNAQGTLTAGSPQSVNVEISGLQGGQTYTVEATGSNGFSTTLSATFTVQAPETGVFMSMEQTDYYVLLTVWTQNVTGEATIQPPESLIPDNTDPILADVTTGAQSFSDDQSFVQPYSSRTYRFFIADSDNEEYDATDFGVTVGTTVAVEGTD